jgi:hypothetical protein
MRTQLLAAATAALTISLAGAATASATTFHASPSATRAQAPCTPDAPCKLSFALGQAFSGDDVALAPGTYDHSAGDPLEVRPGVVVHGSPGATRPLIDQSVAYRDCDGCTVLDLHGAAVLRDVDVRQVEGGGAVEAVGESVIERSSLRGRGAALVFNGSPTTATAGGVRNVLAVAEDGVAILSRRGGPTRYLENVTAIGRGGFGVGISVRSSASTDDTVDAVNTIARGDVFDGQVYAEPSAGINDVATLKLRYSNFRPDKLEKLESDPAWSNAQIETFDNNVEGDPQFVSATDFHLAQTSAAVDKGRSAGLNGDLDLDGRARTFGAKPDIGAYEWHPPVVSPDDPPPPDDGGNGGSGGNGNDTGSGGDTGTQPDGPRQPEVPEQPRDPRLDPVVTAPGLAIARQTVTVKKNVASLKVACPAAAATGCTGTLSLLSGKVKVGSARFSLAAGKRGVVKVKLAKAGRKLIARKRTLKTTATVSDTNAAVTLKLPARRR